MSTEVLWHAEPHTKIKHQLYAHYLAKWMPIMVNGKWRGDVTYAEGFAGPGVYLDGAHGSPVIAFNTIRNDQALRTRQMRRSHNLRMLFVEKDQRRVERLRAELAKAAEPVSLADLPDRARLLVDVQRGECEPTLVQMLDEHRCWGRPILAVLDTWGSGVSAELVRRFARNISSEVLITIQPQFFSRFAALEDLTYGDRVFGGTWWRDVTNQPSGRKTRWLIERYRDAIREAGFTFVLDFELVDTAGKSLYLVFGTNHTSGLRKMKEAMWEVDKVAGSGYRDPRDPDQQVLAFEIEPQTGALRRLILQRLEREPLRRATVQELRNFAFFETVYKESQVPPLIDKMLEARELVCMEQHRNFQTIVSLPAMTA